MKRDQRSLLSCAAGTIPMSAVLLFLAPTIVSAQTTPATTSTNTSTPAGQIYYPTANPQFVYPVVNPAPTAIPVQSNPGGFTVQVTTQIGIPNQSTYPVMGVPGQPIVNGQGIYPSTPNIYPVTNANPGVYPVYPGIYTSTPVPQTPTLQTAGGYTEAIANPAVLPLAAQTLWQQIVSTSSPTNAQNLTTLQQLLREYPNFIPAYIQLAQAFIANNRTQEAISILERGTTLYPNQPELARSLIIALGNANRWNEAAMAARQFVIRNPNSPLATEFTKLAEESTQLAQSPSRVAFPARTTLLGNLLSTGLGYLITGNPSTSDSASSSWNQTPNNSLAQALLNRVQLLNDSDVSDYVNSVGRKLSQAAGRNNFEFYVVRDRDTGALALPDGKIFVSAGSIANTNSEAELAALIAQQMGHSILSHPDQAARRGNLTSTLIRLLPTVGGLVNPKIREFNNSTTGTLVSGLMGSLSSSLFRPSYSSQMLRNANTTATKLLETAGYTQTNISFSSDRHSQMKTKVQQILGTSSPWWSLR